MPSYESNDGVYSGIKKNKGNNKCDKTKKGRDCSRGYSASLDSGSVRTNGQRQEWVSRSEGWEGLFFDLDLVFR